jgi:hypothetical protein
VDGGEPGDRTAAEIKKYIAAKRKGNAINSTRLRVLILFSYTIINGGGPKKVALLLVG